MRLLLVMFLVLAGFGCRKPEVVRAPQARLIVRFLDRDAVLDLAAPPSEGIWQVMNAGQWEPLEVRWKPGALRIGAATVGRTAPDWVLLEDPAREVHRLVLRGPGPEALRERNRALDEDDRDALALLGLLWALGWTRW